MVVGVRLQRTKVLVVHLAVTITAARDNGKRGSLRERYSFALPTPPRCLKRLNRPVCVASIREQGFELKFEYCLLGREQIVPFGAASFPGPM
jgi:hypothetical protein